MRRNKIVLSLLFAGMGTAATAQNINLPIIQTKYTADPAPYVHNDTVYLYTTHDEDGAEGFQMKDWLLYTSTDMVNWQNRGAVASLKDFKWFKGLLPGLVEVWGVKVLLSNYYLMFYETI